MVAIKDMLGDQTVVRADGRKVDELRPVRITRHFTDVPEAPCSSNAATRA